MESCWTVSKRTTFGDLLLVYFLAPERDVHFVARAASDAFFNRDTGVNAETDVANEQWWAYYTPLIEIEPIPFRALQDAFGGHLILRGRSGKFLRPEVLAALPIRAKKPGDQAELDRVLTPPIGLPDLPDPADIDMNVWSAIASGALPLEVHVSSHVVEPLLRHVLSGTALTWRGEYRVGRGFADFAVMDGTCPVAVVEVKLAAAVPHGDWSRSKDSVQLRRYTDELGVAGILIDANRIALFEPGADQPRRIVTRRYATAEDLAAIRAHIGRS